MSPLNASIFSSTNAVLYYAQVSCRSILAFYLLRVALSDPIMLSINMSSSEWSTTAYGSVWQETGLSWRHLTNRIATDFRRLRGRSCEGHTTINHAIQYDCSQRLILVQKSSQNWYSLLFNKFNLHDWPNGIQETGTASQSVVVRSPIVIGMVQE